MLNVTCQRFLIILLLFSVPFWVLGVFVDVKLPGSLPISSLQCIAVLIAAGLSDRSVYLLQTFRRPSLSKAVAVSVVMPMVLVSAYLMIPIDAEATPLLAVLLSIPLFLIAAAAEEAGWSSVLTRQLLITHGLLMTGVVCGLIWAAWHVIGFIQTGHTWDWIILQCMFTVAFRMLLVVVYAIANSATEPTLMHASYNVAFIALPHFGSAYSPELIGLATVATLLLAFVFAYRHTSRI